MLRSLGTSSNGDSGGTDDLRVGPARGPTHHGKTGDTVPRSFDGDNLTKKEKLREEMLTCYNGKEWDKGFK